MSRETHLSTGEKGIVKLLKNIFNQHPAILSFVIFLTGWYLLTKYVIPPIKYPSPWAVVEALYMLRFTVLQHIAATMFRIVVGFFCGSALGVGLGLFMGYSYSANRLLDPLIETARPIPPIATIPFFILWFGIGELGKVLLVTGGCALVTVVTTTEAIRNVPPIYIRAALTLGASRKAIYRTIIVPAIIPHLLSGLRVAAALSFALTVAAEYMGAQAGLGYIVMLARRTLRTQNILLGILLLGLLSSLLDRGIRLGGNFLTRWTERMS